MTNSSSRWTRITSSDRLCRSSQTVAVVGQNLYIFGGEVQPRHPVDNQMDVVALDQELVTVRTIPAPVVSPAPRVGSPSTVLNGRIWIFSGRGGIDMAPLDENGAFWCYNIDQNLWTLVKPADPVASHPQGRSYHCVTSDGINKIYVHAGCPESGRLSDLWVFDIGNRTWTELPLAPEPARGGASIAFSHGNLHRANGFDGTSEQGGALDIFDIATGLWSTVDYQPDGVHGPEARSVAALVSLTLHGRPSLVTLCGERDPSSLGHAGAGRMLSDVWTWDIRDGGWQNVKWEGASPEARGWFDTAVVKEDGDDTIVVHGGLNEGNERLGDVWKLKFC